MCCFEIPASLAVRARPEPPSGLQWRESPSLRKCRTFSACFVRRGNLRIQNLALEGKDEGFEGGGGGGA